MFRLPLRAVAPGVVPPPRRRTRFGGARYAHRAAPPPATIEDTGRVSGAAALSVERVVALLDRAPWEEPARKIPYVIITTQPWPEEWWRRTDRPGASTTRATERPLEIVALPRMPELAPPEEAPPLVAPSRSAQQARRGSGALRADRREDRDRAGSRRRGSLGRLALFVLGLVISLVAVETATRWRS